MAESRSTPWYEMSAEEVLDALDSCRSGLSVAEAQRRLEVYGPNAIEDRTGPSALGILVHQIRDPLIYILFGAIAIAVVVGEMVDAAVIGVVIVFNTVVGFFQEYRAEQAVSALAELVAARAVVLREGKRIEVDSTEIVPGDVVVLESGSRVPADLRLIEVHDVAVDESLLTGESVPVTKSDAPIERGASGGLAMAEQSNVAFGGTLVTTGRALGVVVSTGAGTRLGEISGEIREIRRAETPLQRQFKIFSKVLSVAAAGVAALVVAIGVAQGESLVFLLQFAAAVLVAAIPEGLPVVVTVTLAVGVTRMAHRRAVIRRLVAAETLGSVTAIASDKTGTLTENQMTVKRIYAGGSFFDVEGVGYAPEGSITKDGDPVEVSPGSPLYLLLLAGLLCSDARLVWERRRVGGRREREVGLWRIDGDPTEGALVVAAAKAGLDQSLERRRFPRIAEIPFSPERAYMATLCEMSEDFWPDSEGRGQAGERARLVLVKGAPERVVSFCKTELEVGRIEELDGAEALQRAHELASDGLRVLALAYKVVDSAESPVTDLNESVVESGLCLLGFEGSLDPPRPEAIEAIQAARRCGIKVYMVTGDHRATALAVAQMLGLVEEPDAVVLSGRDLARMSPEDFSDAIQSVRVFARVEPEQKLAIVSALQANGEVVAVTGDGVNDAPSLKRANIGVAMGRTGTDAAKEAADVVLTDDNFATIFQAVLIGRAAYENIRKAVLFLIPTGLGLTIASVAGVLAEMPIPFRPAQIIWINLVTNALQDVAIAFEPAEPGLDLQSPRNPKEPLFNWKMLQRTLVVGSILAAGTVFVFIRGLESKDLVYAQTLAVTTMVLYQNFHLFNSRSFDLSIFKIDFFSNPFLFGTVAAALAAHLAAMYWKPMQAVLGFVPLPATGWMTAIGVASTVLLVVEAIKWSGYILSRRGPDRR